MKISVIVPVYNVERYLKKCVLSIIGQTYKNLEIILVDDGSTDGSLKLCNELQEIDNRIKITHKKNGGLSSARNAGIDIATGELLGFIDSDDWIEPDFFEILYNGIMLNRADISVVHFVRVEDFKKIEFSSESKTEWLVFNRFKAMETLFTNNLISYSAVNKLYKKELFDGIRYPKGMLMEDKATTYRLIHKSSRVVVNLSQKYHYYLRPNSIIRSKFNEKNFDSFTIHEEIIEFIDEEYPELSGVIRARYVHTSIRMLLFMIRSNYDKKEEFNKCIDIINKNKKYAYEQAEMKFSVKSLTLLFSLFPSTPYILSKSKIISGLLVKSKIS